MTKFEIMEAPGNRPASTASIIDETDIIYKTKVNWTAYIMPGIIVFFSGILTLFCLLFFFQLLAIPFGYIFYKSFKTFASGYTAKIIVTHRELTIQSGIFTKQTIDISLKKYEAIHLSQGVIGQMFNFGTLTVSTGEITKSYKVSAPNELRKAIIEASKKNNY